MKTLLVALIISIATCQGNPHPIASATPSCPFGCPSGGPHYPAIPAHVMISTDTGQYFAYGSSPTNFNQAYYKAHFSFARDQRAWSTDVGFLDCQHEGALNSPVAPTILANVRAGIDCLSFEYMNIGIEVQSYIDTDGFGCNDTHNANPYDPFWLYLSNNAPTGSGAPLDNGVQSPILHGAVAGTYVLSNRMIKTGTNTCTSPAGGTGNRAQYMFNPASLMYVNLVNTYSQGQSQTGTVGGGFNETYPWAATASNPCNSPQVCSEPATHFDGYAVYDDDNQFNSVNCPTGTSMGASVELDPTFNAAQAYYYQPGLDAARLSFYSQWRHRDGTPVYAVGNGGDCSGFQVQTYYYDLTNHLQKVPWYAQIHNYIGMNDENNFADPQGTDTYGCNNWSAGALPGAATVEPERFVDRVIHEINSASVSYSYKKFWIWQQTCHQPTTFLSTAGMGGAVDIGLRKWVYSAFMLGFDPNWAVARFNYYGADGTTVNGNATEVMPETNIVALDPVQPLTAYVAAAAPTGGCNGAIGTNGSRALVIGSGESGGIIPFLVPASCGTNGYGGVHYFTQGGVAARQFRSCYNAGMAIGPCAVVVNFRFAGDGSLDWNQSLATTFANDNGPLIPYGHIITFGDGSQDSTEADIASGGALFTNQTQETVVRAKQLTQATTCNQGIISSNIVVCEADGEIFVK